MSGKAFRLKSEIEYHAMQRRIHGEDRPGAALAKADALYRPGSSDSKYGNERTEDGYASKREARRAQALGLLQQAGEISNLREQVRFELIPAQYDADGNLLERSWSYIADFIYRNARGELVCEDAKGCITKEYVAKRKAMLFFHKIRIQEV